MQSASDFGVALMTEHQHGLYHIPFATLAYLMEPQLSWLWSVHTKRVNIDVPCSSLGSQTIYSCELGLR